MNSNDYTARLYGFEGITSNSFYIYVRNINTGNVALIDASTDNDNVIVGIWNVDNDHKAEGKLAKLIEISEQNGERPISYSYLKRCPKPCHQLISVVFNYFRNDSICTSDKGFLNMLKDLNGIEGQGGMTNATFSQLIGHFELAKRPTARTRPKIEEPKYDTWATW